MNTAELEVEFSSVVCAAADYLLQANIDPKTFTDHVNMLRPVDKRLCPNDPNNFKNILNECLIQKNWDCLNYNSFFVILRRFVEAEATKLEKDYMILVGKYSATMKIKEWLEKTKQWKKVKDEVIEHHSRNHKRLSARLHGIKIEETTVAYFKDLWGKLLDRFTLPSMDYILYSIEISSITVTWLIPVDPRIEEQIRKLIPYNEEFFKRFNIVCIMINEEPIYKVSCNGTIITIVIISQHNYEVTNSEYKTLLKNCETFTLSLMKVECKAKQVIIRIQ